MASGHDIGEATKDLGKRWELPQNGLKPFACGQANHGFIDAALALKKQPGVEVDKVLRGVCATAAEAGSRIVLDSSSDSVQGELDLIKLTDAFKWLCAGAMKHKQNLNEAGEIFVTTKSSDGAQAVIEWSGLRNLDHDPFRTFAGSDEVKLALAAKIIEAHGGSAKFIDRKFVVQLPLNG